MGVGYGQAYDPDLLNGFSNKCFGRDCWVFCHKLDDSVFKIEAFECGFFVADHNSGNLPILHLFLLSDIDNISVTDPYSDHALPFTGEGKICPDMAGKIHIVCHILLS